MILEIVIQSFNYIDKIYRLSYLKIPNCYCKMQNQDKFNIASVGVQNKNIKS